MDVEKELLQDNTDSLSWAVQHCPCPEIVNALISAGGNINYRDRNGNTLLHFVNDSIIAEDLISFGLDVNTPNNLGYTPLDVAIQENKNCHIVKTLISAGGNFKNRDFNTLVHLIKNYPTLVEDFISLGFDVNMTNNMGQAPLHYILDMADVNLKDKKGNTPLSLMIRYLNKVSVVKAFISVGGDISVRDSEGNTLLHLYPSLASELTSLGVNVNFTNKDGETPLHCLIKKYNPSNSEEYLEAVQVLIKNDANVHVSDNRGRTPLVLAMEKNAITGIVKALISAGGDIYSKDSDGNTLLHLYPRMVSELISFGLDVNLTNNNGETPLHRLLKNFKPNCNEKYCNAVQVLIQNNADVHATDNRGNTPLTCAINYKINYNIVKALISAGADINCNDSNENTLLHLYPSFVSELISLGLDVNSTNNDGETPLHYFFKNYKPNYSEAVQVLIQNNADMQATDNQGHTPLVCAINNKINYDIVKVLVSVGADIDFRDSNGNTFLHKNNVSPSFVSEVISLGLDVNSTNNYGETPLHYLLKKFRSYDSEKDLEVVKLLIQNNADVHVTDNRGNTPLACAINNNIDFKIVKVLVSAGADINYRDAKGNTFLHKNNVPPSFVSELISLGLDVNAINNDGETPLHYLLKKFRSYYSENGLEVVKLLIQNNADLNATDNRGNTPLSCAINNKVNFNIVKALILAGGHIKCRDSEGNTNLLYPCLARELISLGLDVNAINEDGETPLHYLLKNYMPNYSEEYLEVVKLLIWKNARVHATDKRGHTLHTLACVIKNKTNCNIVKALISAGGQINFRDSDGNTFLHTNLDFHCLASELVSFGLGAKLCNKDKMSSLHCLLKNHKPFYNKEYFEAVEVLIQNNADLNATDNRGYTPLAWALKKNCTYLIVKALISAGADIYYKDSNGNTLLHLYPRMVSELISFGLGVNSTNNDGETPLHYLLKNDRLFLFRDEECLEIVQVMMKNNADVHATDNRGYTPLSSAMERNADSSIVKALISAGADIYSKDSNGNTLLHLYPSLASELTSLGVDVNSTNNDRETPLHYLLKNYKPDYEKVITFKYLEAVQVLIQNNADVHATDKRGYSPLTYAVSNKNRYDIVKTLILAGVHINYRDSKRNTLLHMPEYYSLAKYIISLGFDVNATNNNNQTPLQTLIHRHCSGFSNVHCQLFYLLISNGAELSLTNYSLDFSLDKKLRLIIFEHYYNNKQLNLLHLRNIHFNNDFEIYPVFDCCEIFGIDCYRDNAVSICLRECVQEIVRMKFHMIDTDFSLFDFIKSNYVPKQICTFHDVNTRTFPKYYDLIKFKMSLYFRNKKLLHDIQRVQVAPSKGNKEVVLNYYSLRHILEYLPDVDLCNFMKSIFVVDSATDS